MPIAPATGGAKACTANRTAAIIQGVSVDGSRSLSSVATSDESGAGAAVKAGSAGVAATAAAVRDNRTATDGPLSVKTAEEATSPNDCSSPAVRAARDDDWPSDVLPADFAAAVCADVAAAVAAVVAATPNASVQALNASKEHAADETLPESPASQADAQQADAAAEMRTDVPARTAAAFCFQMTTANTAYKLSWSVRSLWTPCPSMVWVEMAAARRHPET